VNRFEAHDLALARRMELTERIQRFVAGMDVSVASVGLIEAGLDDAFPDNAWISDKVLMLAGYRPGEAGARVDEAQVRAALVEVLARLR
jgi:hypothetical protein